MAVELFEVENGVVKPTEHCYVIEVLHRIMELYPDNFVDRYAYFQYMTCLDEKKNPFLLWKEEDREEEVLASLKSTVGPEEEGMQEALEFCRSIFFNTPGRRAFEGAKKMYERISDFLADTEITTGREGNAAAINTYMKGQKDYAAAYKNAYKEIQEEYRTRSRGDQKKAYDQR